MDTNQQQYVGHYYGDSVRVIFLISGLVMLCSFPFFSSLIGVPAVISILSIIGLVVLGGLISPKSRFIFILSSIVPVVGFILFEYYAYFAYSTLPATSALHIAFFWVNQILAILFFFATYLSVKTLRAMWENK